MAKYDKPPPRRRPSPDAPAQGRGRAPRPRLTIVYEDDDLLVADKPVGMPTAVPPGAGAPRHTLFELVKEHVKRRAVGRAGAWVIHRLDSEVSGLVVFAKSHRAFEWLKEDLRSRRVQREYLALVEGVFEPEPGSRAGRGPTVGTIQTMLVETPDGRVRVLAPGARGAAPARERPLSDDEPRHAVTHYEVLGAGQEHSLLRIRLETGRKHQIRAHMASIGHPVAGDRKYGARSDPLRRVALHGAELGFSHPSSGQPLRLQSAAPAAFWRLAGCTPPPAAQAPAPEAPRRQQRPAARSSWDAVAMWYDELVEDRRSDLHHDVVLPGALRLLEPARGQRMLDLACGQGVLCRELDAQGVQVWGVDASPKLVEVARQRSPRGPRFVVGDATRLGELPAETWPPGGFDAVACVMALMNMDPLSSALSGVSSLLREGGRFVAVLLHPVFRSPGRTSWGWDQSEGAARQYRRVDAYLSPGQREIVMNPGKAVRGAKPIVTQTYHRPLQTYVQHLAAHGLWVDRLEEWPSPRRSQPGPRAAEEDRARREIPMFLGIRAVRAPDAGGGGGAPLAPRGA